MTDAATFLEAMGFVHVENDEPHEDHWILEGIPGGPDLLVEEISERWSVHRDPRGAEVFGQWTPLADGLSRSGMIETVSAQLECAGISVDLALGNHSAREAARAHGLTVDPRIANADLR